MAYSAAHFEAPKSGFLPWSALMPFHIEGIVSRGEFDHEGASGVNGLSYDSVAAAMTAIGRWVDQGEFQNAVCFYIYGENGLAWTVVPHFPDIR